MGLNVNYSSLYKHGIDTSMLKDVSQEILRRAAVKNAQYTNSVQQSQVTSFAKPVEQDSALTLSIKSHKYFGFGSGIPPPKFVS